MVDVTTSVQIGYPVQCAHVTVAMHCKVIRNLVVVSTLYCYPVVSMCATVDINECNANRGICGTGGSCVNTAGSYTCRCNRGYQLRNKKCQGII